MKVSKSFFENFFIVREERQSGTERQGRRRQRGEGGPTTTSTQTQNRRSRAEGEKKKTKTKRKQTQGAGAPAQHAEGGTGGSANDCGFYGFKLHLRTRAKIPQNQDKRYPLNTNNQTRTRAKMPQKPLKKPQSRSPNTS